MCIVLWSTRKESGYVLVIASNRDEFLTRSSENAKYHSFNLNQSSSSSSSSSSSNVILSGLDLIGGGTWLGFNQKSNRFGFLTNLSNPNPKKNSKWKSRGNLLKNYLIQSSSEPFKSLKEYVKEIQNSEDLMDGYHLVIGEIQDHGQKVIIDSYCNHQINQNHQFEKYIENGISNGIKNDDEDEWIKVKLGKDLLTKRMIKETNQETNQESLIEDLFQILSQIDSNDKDLKKNILIRPYHRLNQLTDLPNQKTWYGTKTQTIILISNQKKVNFIERDAYKIINTIDHLGLPIWLGDDKNLWRRFQFDID